MNGPPGPEDDTAVIDPLHGILELRFGEHALTEPAADSQSLHLQLATEACALERDASLLLASAPRLGSLPAIGSSR